MRRQLSHAEQNEYLQILNSSHFQLKKTNFPNPRSWEHLSKGKIDKNNCDHFLTSYKKKKVTVKQVSEKQFNNEGSIFAKLSNTGSCQYIINFIGCHIPEIEKNQEKTNLLQNPFSKHLLVFEYEAKEDACKFLKNLKNNHLIKLQLILEWIINLASALEYLKEHGIVHRNVTAKNCLITSENKLKLGNFKMSRLTVKKRKEITLSDNKCEFVRENKDSELDCTDLDLNEEFSPVQYRAPETRNFKKFTCESDAWSLGVVMWEFFWRCYKKPYDDEKWDVAQIFDRLDEGKRLNKPDMMPQKVYRERIKS